MLFSYKNTCKETKSGSNTEDKRSEGLFTISYVHRHNIHVPCLIILHMADKQKKPKDEFLDETTEKDEENTEYLDEEYEEDDLDN